MNDRLLPGEPQRLRGEPADHVRYVHSLPLDAFRLVHGDDVSWTRDLAWVFTVALFQASRNRRIRTGSKGLMLDAARLVIRHFERPVFRLYRTRRMLVLLTDEARDELAVALASEMRGCFELKYEAGKFLEFVCEAIAETNEDFEGNTRIFSFNRSYSANQVLNIWLDELEYMREKGLYRPFIHIHKTIIDCARVWDAVFGA